MALSLLNLYGLTCMISSRCHPFYVPSGQPFLKVSMQLVHKMIIQMHYFSKMVVINHKAGR